MRSGTGFGRAWLALSITLGLHVADEALTDFLSVYNPIVRQARERFGWFPMPEVTFGRLARRVVPAGDGAAAHAARLSRLESAARLSWPLGVIMFLNGVGHLAGSIYLSRWAPGATTAPLLLVTSTWLLREAMRES